MPQTSAPVPSRLNGRPPACDPCRSRKLACDHQQPICGRCKRLKREDKCVFSASRTRTEPKSQGSESLSTTFTETVEDFMRPLASHSASSSTATSEPLSTQLLLPFQQSLGPQGRHQIDLAQPSYARTATETTITAPSNTPGSSFAAESGTSPTRSSSHGMSASTYAPTIQPTVSGLVPPAGAPGYLGFTSHSTVFEETLSSLFMQQGTHTWLPQLNELNQVINNRNPNEVLMSPVRETAFLVLRNLPTIPHHKIIWKPAHWGNNWLIDPAFRVLESLQARYGCKLAEKPETELEKVALFLSRNSIKPMNDELATRDEWLEQLVGDNMRWESLALLFCLRDFAQDGSGPSTDDMQNNAIVDTQRLVKRYCLSLAIDLCRRFADGNMMLVQLCKTRCTEESMIAGDAAASTWRCHGVAVTLLTYMGYHALTNEEDYVPTFCSEMKRRLYSGIIHVDKTLVLFTGRPPFLSHRYCSTPLPLDVTDEAIFTGGEILANAVRSLDENGWGREDKLSYATIQRARTMIGMIRDELIEFALGTAYRSSVEALLDLKQRQQQVWASFPSVLYHKTEHLSDNRYDTRQIFARIIVQLDHLQNVFLIERLLVRRHGHAFSDDGSLLVTSYQLVCLTLTFWLRMDRFAKFRKDFQWLVMAFGAPGGGILCMELLKPSFSGNHPKDPTLTRSNIVQQLSLLVGFLNWVGPTAPNADICAACKAVIQHVLDHTLNGTGGGTSWPPQTLDASLPDLDFNFEMMDTFGWVRPT